MRDCVHECAPTHLSVVGQVVGTVHELLQRAARPIGAVVAGGQLLRRGRASVAHVQRRLPGGAALDVPPLAEVARHRVPQQGDVVELPVGKGSEEDVRGGSPVENRMGAGGEGGK